MNENDLQRGDSFIVLPSSEGSGSRSPASLLGEWLAFVEECEAGYRWEYSEYANEVRVRSKLEQLLSESEEPVSAVRESFLAELEIIDRRFRDLLQSDVTLESEEGWWSRGVLRYAGYEYCEFMRRGYDLRVRCVEE